MHSILVADYMTRDPIKVATSDSLTTVVEKLLKKGITGAPVVDAEDKLVGFVSEQDCIQQLLQSTYFCDEPPSVTAVMTQELLTVAPNTSVVEVAERMIAYKPKIYPVVDPESGRLQGTINRGQVLRALIENREDCHINI